MNKKTRKKALLSSVISLLLCCVMLMGTTFAWFTDSVSSTSNKIQSGNLDIDLLVEGKSIDNGEFEGAIFPATDLWEPGYTKVANIEIVNKGTLAFEYMLQLVKVENQETTSSYDLASVIDVYMLEEEPAGRADLEGVAPVCTLADVLNSADNDGFAHGMLYPAGNADGLASSTPVTIVLKMREEAGNEYQDLSVGDSFDIVLKAKQLTYEEDSFDDQYDAEATYKWDGTVDTAWYEANPDAETFSLSRPEQLAGLAALVNESNSFAGKTIVLENDMDLAGIDWTPIGDGAYKLNGQGRNGVFSGTFDGNGKSISNVKVTHDNTVPYGSSAYAGFFGKTTNATIKDFSLDIEITSPFDAGDFTVIGGAVGQAHTGTVENVQVTVNVTDAASAKYVGGITGHGYADIKNCSVKGNISPKAAAQLGGIIGMQAGKYIENCYVSANISGGYTIAGGIVGFANGSEGALGAKNCYFTGSIEHHDAYYGSGSNVGGIVGFGYGPLVRYNPAVPYYVASNCYVDAEFVNEDGSPAAADTIQYIVANCGGDYGTCEMFSVVDCSWDGADTYTWYGYQNAENGYVYSTETCSDACTYTAGMTYEQYLAATPN